MSWPITLFLRGAKNTDDPCHAALPSILQWLHDPPDGGLAKYVRRLADDGDPAFAQVKTTLPVAVFSGHFSYRRNDSCLRYSQLVVIDLDDIENADELRDAMRGDPHIAACFLSPSGQGLKPVVATDCAQPEHHRHAWATALAYLTQRYDIDASSSRGQHDLCRSCFIGYDARAWVNEAATPLPVDFSIPVPRATSAIKPSHGAERVPPNSRHNYLLSYTARLASIGLAEPEIIAAAKTLIADRFDLSDGREFPEHEILDAVRGGLRKYAGEDSIAAELDGAEILRAWAENPISSVVLRTHDDRVRDVLIPPPWVIDGLLPVGGVGAVIAQPGNGKTLVSVEMAGCVAAGQPFAGRQTQAGKVAYVCTDAPDDTERRMLAMPAQAWPNVLSVVQAPRFPSGMPDLMVALDKVQGLALLVLDTWDSNRDHAQGGWAEQDAVIESAMSSLRTFARDRSCAVVIVHHATKAEKTTARGSQVFDARCDTMITCQESDGIVSAESTKARAGVKGPIGSWRISAAPHPEAPEHAAIPRLVYMDEQQKSKPSDAKSDATASLEDARQSILRYLAKHGARSQMRIAEGTGLSRATVSRVLGVLRESRLITTSGEVTRLGFETLNPFGDTQ